MSVLTKIRRLLRRDRSATPFSAVRRREWIKIDRRRKAAGLKKDGAQVQWPVPASRNENSPSALEPPPVGLALSGGGIRSGALALGLLQSFYRHGVLRQVDYLSSVSGGGYAACYLTSQIAANSKNDRISWPGEADNKGKPLDFHAEQGSKQSEAVRRLIHSGQYLRKPVQFFNHYILGVLALNAMLCCGWLLLLTLLAWSFRHLDLPDVKVYLATLGFRSDLSRAFAPAFFVFGFWLIWRVITSPCLLLFMSWRRHTTSLLPERLYKADHIFTSCLAATWLILTLCGIAALLNTGDIDLSSWRETFRQRPDPDHVAQLQKVIWALLGVLVVVALLPYFRITDLIQSGTRPKRSVDKWIFSASSNALLCGVPLVVFGAMADEDLGGWNEVRDNRNELSRPHIDFWDKFLVEVQNRKGREIAVDRRVFNAINSARGPQSGAAAVTQILALDSEVRSADRQLWFYERFWYWLAEPAQFEYLRGRLASLRMWQEAALDNLNVEVISDPYFYESFSGAALPDDVIDKARQLALTQQIAKAQQVSREEFAAHWKELPPDKRTDIVLRFHNQPARLDDQPYDRALYNWHRRVQEENRGLLDVYYATLIRPKETVFNTVTLEHDQAVRSKLMAVFFGCFAVAGLLINLNRTSVHRYYRGQLARLWITGYHATSRAPALRQLDATRQGGPYHIVNGAVQLMPLLIPHAQEPTDCFVFSSLYCGSDRTRYRCTRRYDNLDVADAMAISGGALSPLASLRNPMLFYVLMSLNVRLGQWIANPSCRKNWPFPAFIPAMGSFLVGSRERSSYCFVSDGGHHDNTGIETLLRRRCRIIIAFDGSQDSEYKFVDLLKLIRRMKVIYGITLQPVGSFTPSHALESVVPAGRRNLSRSHFCLFRISYSEEPGDDKRDGYLVYLKSSLTGDEPPDLLRYRDDNVLFPHDPTLDQFYDPRRLQNYRELGHHIGDSVYRQLFSAFKGGTGKENCLWLSSWKPAPLRGGEPGASELRVDEHTLSAENVDLVISWLSNTDPYVRKAAINTLVNSPLLQEDAALRQKVTTGLREAMNAGSYSNAEMDDFIWALRELGQADTSVRKILVHIALRDSRRSVRGSARWALRSLGPRRDHSRNAGDGKPAPH